MKAWPKVALGDLFHVEKGEESLVQFVCKYEDKPEEFICPSEDKNNENYLIRGSDKLTSVEVITASNFSKMEWPFQFNLANIKK